MLERECGGVTEQRASEMRLGVIYAISAYLIYGFMPIYMNLLSRVPPTQIMAHRVIWSLVLLAVVASLSRRWGDIRAALANRRTLLTLMLTATMIGANWLVYIWAVLNRHILETSLGFFITPLITVALGVVVLRERLRRAQAVAVALAAVGVAALATGQGGTLWIALFLAFTFSTYGLIRKMAPVDPLCGLLIETALLAPIAVGWLIWVTAEGAGTFGANHADDLLLLFTGVVTALPLLLFTAATKRMPYSTIGLFQYIGPTLQFLQAVLLFGEPFSELHLFTFACIWTGLAVFAFDGVRTARQTAVVLPE